MAGVSIDMILGRGVSILQVNDLADHLAHIDSKPVPSSLVAGQGHNRNHTQL